MLSDNSSSWKLQINDKLHELGFSSEMQMDLMDLGQDQAKVALKQRIIDIELQTRPRCHLEAIGA